MKNEHILSLGGGNVVIKINGQTLSLTKGKVRIRITEERGKNVVLIEGSERIETKTVFSVLNGSAIVTARQKSVGEAVSAEMFSLISREPKKALVLDPEKSREITFETKK